MFDFFKRKPEPVFVPYVRIFQNGHGKYSMKHYPEPDTCFWIPVPNSLANIHQAEAYAEKFLDDIIKSNSITFISQIPK